MSFGNLLIKQVAEDLGRELPRLKAFATLSPIPGFRSWLVATADAPRGAPMHADLTSVLAKLGAPRWFEDSTLAAGLQQQLAPLCAHYLLYAKQQDQEPRDPVARFHLVNGAQLVRLNWLGDTSATGMRQSAGMMVNYVYRLAEVERNHEAYARDRTVVASRGLELLARRATGIRL